MVYEIRLYLATNDFITLETFDRKEQAVAMLLWYDAHRRFFNGVFEIVEVKGE